MKSINEEEVAVRAHDIAVCMERSRAVEHETLRTLGLAVRLALHLRGVQPLEYSLLRNFAVHLLNFGVAEVRQVIELLAEAEFVSLHTEGKTIKAVVPEIPYFENIYKGLGEVAIVDPLNENEQLTVALLQKLGDIPMSKEHAYTLGAEPKLVKSVIEIGSESGFLIERRARGKDILISPSCFGDNQEGYADLIAAQGASPVRRVLNLLKENQGWPFAKIMGEKRLGGETLTVAELAIIRSLASDGYVRPPALTTAHAGTNHFLFGPRPGVARLPLSRRSIYENAMAVVAAVRQGQLLPKEYRIRYPTALLRALRDKKSLGANSEAMEQYRQIAFLGVARLERHGDKAQLKLIDRPENIDTINLAIQLIDDGNASEPVDDDLCRALRKGEAYVDALIGRKRLAAEAPLPIDQESQDAIDTLLLGGYSR